MHPFRVKPWEMSRYKPRELKALLGTLHDFQEQAAKQRAEQGE